MSINSDLYLHPSDKAALQALKAVPGFSQFVKAYMKIWDERSFRISNMSSNLKLGEKQMSKYYDMLPPICEKLGIPIPELYLTLDVNPNAYTYGDTNPFIVITSGLLETLPDELIPTVLAHECGHIACHHAMYTTMAGMIMNGFYLSSGLAALVTMPIKLAFSYWVRCSEFSADRAAAICDGAPNKMIETCMRFAGYDKDIPVEANIEAFLEQALEYKEMVSNSAMDKTLEFLMFNQSTHPLTAVRAYECNEWGHGDQFRRITALLSNGDSKELSFDDHNVELPVRESSKFYCGKSYHDVLQAFENDGFKNIKLIKSTLKGMLTREGQVIEVSVNEDDSFIKGAWFSKSAEVKIIYYAPETAEEAAVAHEGKIQLPDSSRKYLGRNYMEVKNELSDAGFKNFITEEQPVRKSWATKENAITKISICGQTQFDKGNWFTPDSIIRINYQVIAQGE